MHPAHLLTLFVASTTASCRKVCEVRANNDGTDDSVAIHEAFKDCGQGGTVLFSNTTYHVERALETMGLDDCRVELKGTLLVRVLIKINAR